MSRPGVPPASRRIAARLATAAAGVALAALALGQAAAAPTPSDPGGPLDDPAVKKVLGTAPAVLWLLNLTGPGDAKPPAGTLSTGLTTTRIHPPPGS